MHQAQASHDTLTKHSTSVGAHAWSWRVEAQKGTSIGALCINYQAPMGTYSMSCGSEACFPAPGESARFLAPGLSAETVFAGIFSTPSFCGAAALEELSSFFS